MTQRGCLLKKTFTIIGERKNLSANKRRVKCAHKLTNVQMLVH